MEDSNTAAGMIMWLVIIGSIVAYVIAYRKKVAQLKEEYERALLGNDKRIALQAGRSYYAYLRRKGKLTIYDEQAITNDLSAMDDARKTI